MSLNHGRSTAPPVCRICGAEMARLVPVCFALPGEGRKSSFTGLHFDAFVGSSNVHQETQILLPFRLRAKGLTDISHSWVENLLLEFTLLMVVSKTRRGLRLSLKATPAHKCITVKPSERGLAAFTWQGNARRGMSAPHSLHTGGAVLLP